jgi:hypothetical protein
LEEETMRMTIVIALFAFVLAGTAFAGDSNNGCKVQGTWIGETPYPLPSSGYYMLKFVITYQGTGDTEGTVRMEFANPIPMPGTLWSSAAHGVWAKTGPNTYKYTELGFIYDAMTGEILTIVRHIGRATIKTCNEAEFTGTTEYLNPDYTPQYPGCIPITGLVHRVLLQEAESCRASQ